MGSLELLSYFWSLNTIPVVQISNFDLGGLSHPPIIARLQRWPNFRKNLALNVYFGLMQVKSVVARFFLVDTSVVLFYVQFF